MVGHNALKSVKEEQRKRTGPVLTLHLNMEELNAKERNQNTRIATHKIVQLTVDGVSLVVGHNALKSVKEEQRKRTGTVLTLHLNMEELNAKERNQNTRIATHKIVQLTVDGVSLVVGHNALKSVKEEQRKRTGTVLTLHLNMEELNAKERNQNTRIATHKIVQLTVDGVSLVVGHNALKSVKEEQRKRTGTVLTLHLNMEELNAKERNQNTRIATHKIVQLTVDGVSLVVGHNALKSVKEEQRKRTGPVLTLHLNMEELNAKERNQNTRIATHKIVQLTVDGVSLVVGHNALKSVKEEQRKRTGPVLTLHLNMEELNAKERNQNTRIATHKIVQLTVDGVSLVVGHNALKSVKEEPNKDLDNVPTQQQLTEERNVLSERVLRIRNVTLMLALVSKKLDKLTVKLGVFFFLHFITPNSHLIYNYFYNFVPTSSCLPQVPTN